jgi:hypothetical protein
LKRPVLRGAFPVIVVVVLAGCTVRFQSFPFVTATGERVEIRQSPGRSREQETVFAPKAAQLSSPLYSLRHAVQIDGSRQAFGLTYESSLPDSRLVVFSDRNTVLRSASLPPSPGIPIRYLVPLAEGDRIWGYQLKAGSPAGSDQSLHLMGAGTAHAVHGFDLSAEGLSVDGSVEIMAVGPDGVSARITAATQKEMARGIWTIRLGMTPGWQLRDSQSTIRFTSADGAQAVFSVDQAAGLVGTVFARGSMAFLPQEILSRIPVDRMDISFAAVDRPIPAAPGMILSWDRATWRRPDFEVYSWDRFPSVLIFDTATYDVQDDMFKRLAYFVEKAGYRGEIESPAALAGRHGYNAHDYRSEDLARFFSEAATRGLALTPGEQELEKILEASDVIRRTSSGFDPGEGAVISISRSSSPILRDLLLTHESAHGIFFSLPQFRDGVEAVWDSLSPVEQDVWKDYLASKAYDITDHYLVVNEFQAYLFQQRREDVDSFQAVTLSRMIARGGQAAALARRLLAEHPRSFLDSFDALDARLRAAGGPPGSHVLAVTRQE